MNSQQTKLTATTPDKSLLSSKNLVSPNNKKNEIYLDNDVNVIVEDYEEGESITWYKCEDTEEIQQDENIAKYTNKWQNQSPKGSKLLQDQIYMKQQYIIKNSNTGECLDLRDFKQSQFQVLQKMIPDRVQIWKNWWVQKQQNNEQFIKACQFNFQQKIIEFLNYTPNDLQPLINQVDEDGCSPLHYAVQNSNVQICHQLLAHQADPNISNKNGQTPLILAILNNHEQITIQLIQSGANINAYDFQKNTPLHYAFLNGNRLLIEILMRKSHLNLEQTNIDDKQAFEMNESADLIRLYSQLLEVRERQIKKEEQYNVKIINQTNSEIQKTFTSPNKNNVNGESRTPSNKIDKNSMFTVLGQIGRGSFGEVFLVKLNSNKQQYALKLLKKSQLIETQMMKYAYTERNILSQADCPFLAKLHFAFQTTDKLFLVMDNGEYGDLSQHLQVAQRFDEERVKFYCAQILIALEYLHSKNVIYRDLKSDNVVVSKDGYLLLTDFGLAKENVSDFNYGATSFCGSLAYMSPEMFKQNAQHGKSTDIYQFGVLLYELLTGNPPFFVQNQDQKQLQKKIQFTKIDYPSYISKNAKNLMNQLLIKDPRFRPTYGQVKEHPFFREIDWKKIQKKELIPPKPIITKQRYKRIQQDIFKDGILQNTDINKSTNFSNFKFQKNIENIRNIDCWTFVNSNCDDKLNSDQNNNVLSMKN